MVKSLFILWWKGPFTLRRVCIPVLACSLSWGVYLLVRSFKLCVWRVSYDWKDLSFISLKGLVTDRAIVLYASSIQTLTSPLQPFPFSTHPPHLLKGPSSQLNKLVLHPENQWYQSISQVLSSIHTPTFKKPCIELQGCIKIPLTWFPSPAPYLPTWFPSPDLLTAGGPEGFPQEIFLKMGY